MEMRAEMIELESLNVCEPVIKGYNYPKIKNKINLER